MDQNITTLPVERRKPRQRSNSQPSRFEGSLSSGSKGIVNDSTKERTKPETNENIENEGRINDFYSQNNCSSLELLSNRGQPPFISNRVGNVNTSSHLSLASLRSGLMLNQSTSTRSIRNKPGIISEELSSSTVERLQVSNMTRHIISSKSLSLNGKKSNTDQEIQSNENVSESEAFKRDPSTQNLTNTCFICLGRPSRKKPLIHLPCRSKCNKNLVHEKCIFEWKEQQKGKGSCPLCRGKLGKISYVPHDYLKCNLLSYIPNNFDERRMFMLSPIPKKAGMVRCYLRVRNSIYWGSPSVYEFYLQKRTIKKYPHGPLPDAKSPYEGDIFLMNAKKRTSLQHFFSSLQSMAFNSCIDISMQMNDFDRSSSNYLGFVQSSSFTGLEYTVYANIYADSGGNSIQPATSTAKVHGVDSNCQTRSRSRSGWLGSISSASRKKSQTTVGQSTKTISLPGADNSEPSVVTCPSLTKVAHELASVHYTQNRVGAESGPRKMKVILPRVHIIPKSQAEMSILGNPIDQNSLSLNMTSGESSDVQTHPDSTLSSEINFKSKPTELFENIEDFSSDDTNSDASDIEASSKNIEEMALTDGSSTTLSKRNKEKNVPITDFYKTDNKHDTLGKILRKMRHTNNSSVSSLSNYTFDTDPFRTGTLGRHFPSTVFNHTQHNIPGSGLVSGSGKKFWYGKNKEPYWLERIQAYSLDFSGRVTLPSNKNFQIELQQEYNSNDNHSPASPELPSDIVLQFGKVVGVEDNNSEELVSLYTVDFKYPVSPLQALGICLTSCDRKFACA